MEIFIKTLKGLEEILKDEVEVIGGKNVAIENRGVSCQGDTRFLYRANYELRTALRVLLPKFHFLAHTERDFYRKAKKIDWSEILTPDMTFAVDAVCHSKVFRHSKFIGLRLKDAIVDQFKDATGTRPNVDVQKPDVLINLHITELKVIISIDSSGDSLHKRGYRAGVHDAPINEVLAAGILKMTQWKGEVPFIDPMCGSGTFLLEAAMLASNTAPQKINRDLGFTRWKNFDSALFQEIIKAADQRELPLPTILGSDIDAKSVSLAQTAIRRLGWENQIQVSKTSFFKSENTFEDGVLVFNPPYGERLNEADIIDFYRQIGDQMKANYSGFSAWIISSNLPALKHVGLKPSKKVELMNGALPCKLHLYELYSGTKRVRESV